MSSAEQATLGTLGWFLLTIALLFIGTYRVEAGWSILPGLVRGARDWAAAHMAARAIESPAAWTSAAWTSAAPMPLGSPRSTRDATPAAPTAAVEPFDPDVDPRDLVEIEDLGSRSI